MARLSFTGELLGLVELIIKQLEDGRRSDRTRIRLLDDAIAQCRKLLRRHGEARAKARAYELIYVCTVTKQAYGWRPPSNAPRRKADNQLSLAIITYT